MVAILWLEVQHPARPWHTAALGAALAAYLLTTHIAESGADAGRAAPPPAPGCSPSAPACSPSAPASP